MTIIRTSRYMHTYAGTKYWPLEPLPEEVDIETIAHHLAMRCRWNGATKGFLSVAEHAVNVSRFVPRWCALEALHHDSSEAYNGDLIRPLKYSPEFAEPFKKVEKANDIAIARKFGLKFDPITLQWPAPVHKADEMVTAAERNQAIIMAPGEDWNVGKLHDDSIVAPVVIEFLDWRDAKVRFLNRHRELMASRDEDLLTLGM